MKIYLVGGAVRDKLLGLPVIERDWVVVGATPLDMLQLGYRQVGKEFPIFLHGTSNEEYALARMERKVKPGYTGFVFDASPEVTLEEDLMRRDLTINAMAESEEGVLIDPYHGKKDLNEKILRHVSKAFAEDPVRILRVGRFYARYAALGFKIAAETIDLMQAMVTNGEVNALVSERVWKELDRALSEKNPEKFFEALDLCHALPILFPLHTTNGQGIKNLTAAKTVSPLPIVRFAALMMTELEQPAALEYINKLCERYRVPNAYKELAVLTVRHQKAALKAKSFNAEQLLTLLNGLDVFRREARAQLFLQVCKALSLTQGIEFDVPWLQEAFTIAKACDIKPLLEQNLDGPQLAKKIKALRQDALNAWLNNKQK